MDKAKLEKIDQALKDFDPTEAYDKKNYKRSNNKRTISVDMNFQKENEINEELFREINSINRNKAPNISSNYSKSSLNKNYKENDNLNWINFPTKYLGLLPKIRKYIISHIDEVLLLVSRYKSTSPKIY